MTDWQNIHILLNRNTKFIDTQQSNLCRHTQTKLSHNQESAAILWRVVNGYSLQYGKRDNQTKMKSHDKPSSIKLQKHSNHGKLNVSHSNTHTRVLYTQWYDNGMSLIRQHSLLYYNLRTDFCYASTTAVCSAARAPESAIFVMFTRPTIRGVGHSSHEMSAHKLTNRHHKWKRRAEAFSGTQ
jgi:hypothetical protein